MTDDLQPSGEFLLYTSEDGQTLVECRFQEETTWLSQKTDLELFGVKVPTINEHLKTLYESGGIDPDPTIRKFRIVHQKGARDTIKGIENLAKKLPKE